MNFKREVNRERLDDLDVWAYCLVAGTYLEGIFRAGDVFQVGYCGGEPIPTVRYPAVRMELLRAEGKAERTVSPLGGGSSTLAVTIPPEATDQRKQMDGELHGLHSGTGTVGDEVDPLEKTSEYRPGVHRTRRSANPETKGSQREGG